jgi:hypothetical protein
MTPLDALYGPGTSAAFAEKVSVAAVFPAVSATTTEWANPDGSVGTETTWTTAKGVVVGLWRLVWHPTSTYCPGMVIELGSRGKGLLLAMCGAINTWWASIGITEHLFADEGDSNARRAHALAGFVSMGPGLWGCPIPSTRLEEAVAYAAAKKAGESPAEPPWRSGLPVPAEEVF